MIPDKSRKEWSEIISGNNELKIQSFSLKMKITNLRKAYTLKMTNMKDAVDDLYKTCIKYEKLYKNDLEQIFK